MDQQAADHARRLQRGTNTERTIFFSDAVFAIAMTLLALDLKLPDVPADISEQGFNDMLLGRLPSMAAFVLSFALVGRAWLMHGWVDPPLYKWVLRAADPVWVVFLLSIPLAFIRPSAALYSWILIWPVTIVQGRLGKSRFLRAESVQARADSTSRQRGEADTSGPGGIID